VKRFGALLLRAASLERGALLWVPCLLAAVWLSLFGLRQAPELRLWGRLTVLRVLVGPWECASGAEPERAALLRGLRHGLDGKPELAVIDSARVARALGPAPAGGRESFLRATRWLNPQLCLTGTVERAPGGLRAALQVWQPRDGRRLLDVAVQGPDATRLGAALADSVRTLVFRPGLNLASTP
jgi:hypothetical protein